MWQRKQTIYLLLIAICLLALQVLPIMYISDPVAATPDAHGLQGMPREVYCAWILNPNNHNYAVGWWSVMAVLSVAAAVLAIVTVFGYSNLKRQMKYCRMGQLLLLFWIIAAGIFVIFANSDAAHSITVQFGLCLPMVSVILFQLAYNGVKHDYDLIRSADRIR